MTVKELILQLEAFDENIEVYVVDLIEGNRYPMSSIKLDESPSTIYYKDNVETYRTSTKQVLYIE